MSFTRRQAVGLVVTAALGVVIAAAALLGQMAVAVAALGVAVPMLFLAVLRTHQRMTEVLSAMKRPAGGLTEESWPLSARQLGRLMSRRLQDQTREVEALLQLFRDIEPRAPMPSSGKTALNPTGLLELCALVERLQPKLVLELGSGTSSVWIAYALERYGGRLITVDHNPVFAAETRARLRRHGLSDVAEVRDAPLTPVTVDGQSYRWYDVAAFTDLSDVDLLVVDGPPADSGPLARYPAFPVLKERLSPHSVVVLDDISREDEQDILRQWADSTAGLEREPGTVGNLAVLAHARQ